MKKLLLLVVALALAVGVASLVPEPAAATELLDPACQGRAVDATVCDPDGGDTITGPNGIIQKAANLVAIIAGIAAVIGIIIGGFMFVTAAGDSGKVSTGKKTITYSVVGLIIIALARTIVVFVISRV